VCGMPPSMPPPERRGYVRTFFGVFLVYEVFSGDICVVFLIPHAEKGPKNVIKKSLRTHDRPTLDFFSNPKPKGQRLRFLSEPVLAALTRGCMAAARPGLVRFVLRDPGTVIIS
jgi:hypothetical protein